MGRIEYIIPGGRSKKGESDKDTLRRELKEELNVELVSCNKFGSIEKTAIFENIPIFMDIYKVKVKGTLFPKNEIKELVWIDKNYKEEDIKLGTVLSQYVIPRLVDEGLM